MSKFKPNISIVLSDTEVDTDLVEAVEFARPIENIRDSMFEYFNSYNEMIIDSMPLSNLFIDIYTALEKNGIYEFIANSCDESECMLLKSGEPLQHIPILDIYKSKFILPKTEVVSCDTCIIKSYTLFNNDEYSTTIYIQQYLIVLREICLQIYANYLNKIRKLTRVEYGINLVVIPQIYKVTKQANKISNYMEKIDIIPTKVFFSKWDKIIKSVFNWFERNNLFHNDTAHRNVYFTIIDKRKKLAIIDFGEAYSNVPYFSTIVQGKETGYYRDQDFKHFKAWLNGKYPEEFNFDEVQDRGMYGGFNATKRKGRKKRRKGRKTRKLSR